MPSYSSACKHSGCSIAMCHRIQTASAQESLQQSGHSHTDWLPPAVDQNIAGLYVSVENVVVMAVLHCMDYPYKHLSSIAFVFKDPHMDDAV